MATILDTIILHKKEELKALQKQKGFPKRATPKRPFAESLDQRPKLGLISEIKKASPSKGVIQPNFDPIKIAQIYQSGGASAISVLTDKDFFQGSTEYLVNVRNAVSLPVLRKDFIIDPLQMEQTASLEADAVLLIAAALDDTQLRELYTSALELELDPLIEVHSLEELERVLPLEPPIIGINNRNLATFETTIETTIQLIAHIPDQITVVAESGIHTGEQARKLQDAGVRALLVGESLMRAQDIVALMKELTGINRI